MRDAPTTENFPKGVCRARPSKSEAEVSSERAHQAAQFRNSSPHNRTDDIHLHQVPQPHDSLRLPRNSTSTPPTTQSAALAIKSYHVTFACLQKICATHVWNDFDAFGARTKAQLRGKA